MSERFTDHDLDALFRGQPPEGLSDLGPLVDRLRRLAVPVESRVARSHVAAAADEATRPGSGIARGRLIPIRRRTVFAGIFTSLIAKALAGAVALAAAAGAGVAGSLPDPVQGFVDDHVIGHTTDQLRHEAELRFGELTDPDGGWRIEERVRTDDGAKVQTKTQVGAGSGPGPGGEVTPTTMAQHRFHEGAGSAAGTQSQTQSQSQEGTQSQTQSQEGTQSQTQSQSQEGTPGGSGPGTPSR